MDMSGILPEECIAHIISLTSPRNVCRSSAVSPIFRSAADSDTVWVKFLPSDHLDIISQSTSSSSELVSLSKKELYFYLCSNPILLNDGTLSSWIDRESGKKCHMVGGRGLNVAWGNDTRYWEWKSLPESRFLEVPKLRHVWWLEVDGKLDTKLLSPKTTYTVYFVFKLTTSSDGFQRSPVKLSVYFNGSNNDGEKRSMILDPTTDAMPLPDSREDGWKEIEMGEFFNEYGDDGTVICRMFKCDRFSIRGLIVEGIEFRPKRG